MIETIPDLPKDPEMARLIWDTGRFWVAMLAFVGTLAALLWTSAAKFGRLDETLRSLNRSVDKLGNKIDESADHKARIIALEQWRAQIDAWMRRTNGHG